MTESGNRLVEMLIEFLNVSPVTHHRDLETCAFLRQLWQQDYLIGMKDQQKSK